MLGAAGVTVLYTACVNAAGNKIYTLAFCLRLRPPKSSILSALPWVSRPCSDSSVKFRAILEKEPFRFRKLYARDLDIDTRSRDVSAVAHVGVMANLLRQGGYIPRKMTTPTTSDVDYPALMDLPLPFPPHAPAGFEKKHLTRMTRLQYLEVLVLRWCSTAHLYPVRDIHHHPCLP